MSRMYTAMFDGISVAAIQDIFEVIAPSDAVVIIHSIRIGQSSDFGDSEAEGLRVILSRTDGTTSGSGGGSVTPKPHEKGDPAFGGTVERNNTTQATVTTEILADVYNIQAGWEWRPTPEERIVLSPSETFVVELPAAPTDAVTMSASITFEEIGG